MPWSRFYEFCSWWYIYLPWKRVLYDNRDITSTYQEFLNHPWKPEFYYMFIKMPTGLFPEPAEFIPYIYYLRPTLLSPSNLRFGHSSFLLAKILCVSKLAACGHVLNISFAFVLLHCVEGVNRAAKQQAFRKWQSTDC